MADTRTHPPVRIGLGARLMAGVFALAVAFGLCELAARVVYPAPPLPSREPQLLYQSDPEVGFVHVPNQTGWLDDGLATINAMGLRGQPPASPKPDGTLRILAVGDSTTFGWGVGDSETYTAAVQRLFDESKPVRHVEVINAGVGAYDLKQDAAMLKRLVPMLMPDVVLVGLFWNDLPYGAVSPDGAAQQGAAPVVPATSGKAGGGKPFRIGNQPSRLNQIVRQSRVAYVLRHAWLKAIAPTEAASNQVRWEMALLEGKESPAIDAAWKDIEQTLSGIRGMAEAAGFKVGVVIIPIRAQVEGDYPVASYQTRARGIAESLGMFVVDPLVELRKQADRSGLFIPYDRMHFSASGNAGIGRVVFDALAHRPEFATLQVP